MYMPANAATKEIMEASKPYIYETYLDHIYRQASRDKNEYVSAEDIIKDIINSISNESAFNRLFCFAYPLMKNISRYLMYSNTLKTNKSTFKYACLQDKDNAEAEILVGFLEVLKHIRNNISIVENKDIKHIRNIFNKRIRNATNYNAYKVVGVDPHQERLPGVIRKQTIYISPQKLDCCFARIGHFSSIIERDCINFIQRKTKEFIQNKNREEKVIFYLTVLKTDITISNGLTVKLSDFEVAEIASVTVETVQDIKQEFRDLWEKEIQPYIRNNFAEAKNFKECNKYIQDKIYLFLNTKSNGEKLTFALTIFDSWNFMGKPLSYRITDQDVAQMLGTTKRVVEYIRNRKLLLEFRKFWNVEISPYI